MNITFNLLSTEIELADQPTGAVSLYERHYFINKTKVVQYRTEDENGSHRYWEATRDPETLTNEERHKILEYCLSSFDDDEIVNYHDLFLHGEFIKETTLQKTIH